MARLLWSLAWIVLASLYTISQAQDQTQSDSDVPAEFACGYIVNTANSTGRQQFPATLAYKCLTSVPINPAIASSLLRYVKDTLQTHSTLSTLKKPPHTYHYPPVDLPAGLDKIQHNVDAGTYQNQYEFETAVQQLLMSAHETHLYIHGGITSVFTFGALSGIASASVDGKELPLLYMNDDLIAFVQGDTDSPPSPITTINGEVAAEFVAKFANSNALGALDPHISYNQALAGAVRDVLGSPSLLEGSTLLYPGDQIIIGFSNGTTSEPFPWVAFYDDPGDTGPLQTPGDFFNFFVAGFYPASYSPPDEEDLPNTKRGLTVVEHDSEWDSRKQRRQDRSRGWGNLAYPETDVAQDDLSTLGTGFLSGYFLKDTSVAVLSVPSFQEDAAGTDEFVITVSRFIKDAKDAGLKKVVIDLQQNTGGSPFLAIDMFKQFFPDVQPFVGSRGAATDLVNILGNFTTTIWHDLPTNDSEYYSKTTSGFNALPRINALTGQNFTSWPEFFGPVEVDGAFYTTPQQYNLSSFIFDVVSRGGKIQTATFGYANNPSTYFDPPWQAKDIILLTDGQCGSSCALFVEMMTQDAGARTVVAGGLPMSGPMQAVGLTRGAGLLTSSSLDAQIGFVQDHGLEAAAALPNRTDIDFFIQDAAVNFRDQIRPNDTEALQFKYLAAHCRIFYTVDNFYNFSRLWQDAADAIWRDPSICVEGSTGFTGTPRLPPEIPDSLLQTGQSPAAALAGKKFINLDDETAAASTLSDGEKRGSARSVSSAARTCNSGQQNPCPGGNPCIYNKSVDKTRNINTGKCPPVGGTSKNNRGTCPDCARKRGISSNIIA